MTIQAENNKKTEVIKESLGELLIKLEYQKQMIAASNLTRIKT